MLLALLLAQEAVVRKALLEAVTQANPSAIERQVSLALPLKEAPALLADAYDRAVQTIKELEKERARWEKGMEEHRGRWEGNTWKGDSTEFVKARDNHAAAVRRLDVLRLWYPRLLGALPKVADAATPWLSQLLQRADWYVRAHAVVALSGRPDEFKTLLEHAGKERNPGVRAALAEALSGRAGAVALLESWLADANWQVRIAAARSLAATKNRRSAEPLIASLRGTEGRVQHETNEALKSLTGVDKHGNFDAWNEWWNRHGEEFVAGTYQPRTSERAELPGHSTFYGIRVSSTRLLFILDVSSSMVEKAAWMPEDGPERPKGDRCIDVAQFELCRILRSLPDSAEFNIMLFHGENSLLFEKAGRGRSHAEKAIKFLDSVKIQSGTDLFSALRRTFELCGGSEANAPLRTGGFDSVYLLTDGAVSAGLLDRDLLVERVLEMNRFRHVAIHGIGISAPNYGEEILRKISGPSGGSYIAR